MLSEEAILKWYKEAHVAKGKSVFLDQMKKFVEWLQNAEEGLIPFNRSGGHLANPFSLSSKTAGLPQIFLAFLKLKFLKCLPSISNTQPSS